MKSFITFLFILVASTTYRCGKGEDTIDCVEATAQMIGSWDGVIMYSAPGELVSPASGETIPSAEGVSHSFTLEVNSVSECIFIGKITYGEISNNTVYEVSGSIDKYGWVTFTEQKFINDGNIHSSCASAVNNSSKCSYWPTGRWIVGGLFSRGRFTNDPIYEWEGDFRLPTSNYGMWNGITFEQVDEISGNN